jgi:hypothetical protein
VQTLGALVITLLYSFQETANFHQHLLVQCESFLLPPFFLSILFADDANIQIEATNVNILNKKIQEVMQQLSSWFSLSKLVINTEKPLRYHSMPGRTKVT